MIEVKFSRGTEVKFSRSDRVKFSWSADVKFLWSTGVKFSRSTGSSSHGPLGSSSHGELGSSSHGPMGSSSHGTLGSSSHGALGLSSQGALSLRCLQANSWNSITVWVFTVHTRQSLLGRDSTCVLTSLASSFLWFGLLNSWRTFALQSPHSNQTTFSPLISDFGALVQSGFPACVFSIFP